MGFGLLFIGMMLLTPTTFQIYYSAPIAALFLALATWRLRRVNTPFGWGFYLALLLGGVSLGENAVRLLNLTTPTAILDGILSLVLLAFLVTVMTGIEWVSQETDLGELRRRAFRQKIFCVLYLVPQIPMNFMTGGFIPQVIVEFMASLALALMVVGFVIMILNLLVVFTAYMRICMPEDVSMEQKTSRFGFVNRYREAKAQKEKERQALLEEEKKAYAEKQRAKRANKKK